MDDQRLKKIAAFYDQKKVQSFLESVLETHFLHIGLYGDEELSVDDASKAILAKMLKLLPKVNKSTKFLELGAGKGAGARFIVDQYGSKVDCVNISKVENKLHTKLNSAEEIYEQSIKILEGDFQDMLFENANYDFVLAQESLLHSAEKEHVFRQITRALKPEGRLVLTEIMKTDNAEENNAFLLEKQGLIELATLATYKRLARTNNLYTAYIREMPEELKNHALAVLNALGTTKKKVTSADQKFVSEICQDTIDAVDKEQLTWGILIFQKINT
ncbi:MAG: class I SAM-dependent methyltransferase [Saprospiraceae bacterium]|nr:class I SAM-dependent methyltransferase [Saprospiraceae bacterium]